MKRTGDEEKEPRSSFTRTQLYLIGGSVIAIVVLAFSLAHLLSREETPPPPETEQQQPAPETTAPSAEQPATAPETKPELSKLEQTLPKQTQPPAPPAPAPVAPQAAKPATPPPLATGTKAETPHPVIEQTMPAKAEVKRKEKPKVKTVKKIAHKKQTPIKKKTAVKAKKPKQAKAAAKPEPKRHAAESHAKPAKTPALNVTPGEDSFTTEAPQPALAPINPVEVAPLPKPAPPAPKPAPPTPGENAAPAQQFSVTAATFAAEAEAKALEQSLAAKGHKTFIVKDASTKTTWYRVMVGNYGSREDAEAAAATLSETEKLKAKASLLRK